MKLDDIKISQAIIERFSSKLLNSLECDVAIVGGGPAGLTAAFYLAQYNKKVVLFEKNLELGGRMWCGGMMFNEIVVNTKGKEILDEFNVRTSLFADGYYSANSIETVTTICSSAAKAGAHLFNLIMVEDLMMTDTQVTGLVINWGTLDQATVQGYPLTIRARAVIDATGGSARIARDIQKKQDCELLTSSGTVIGEQAMSAEAGEKFLLENTREFYPGVYAAGTSCNAIFGGPRLGPVFGGTLRSGKKAAHLILDALSSSP